MGLANILRRNCGSGPHGSWSARIRRASRSITGQTRSAQSAAATKRDRCFGLVVATTTSARSRVTACAARMTSPSSAASGAVGRPRCRASAHNEAARRIAEVVIGKSPTCSMKASSRAIPAVRRALISSLRTSWSAIAGTITAAPPAIAPTSHRPQPAASVDALGFVIKPRGPLSSNMVRLTSSCPSALPESACGRTAVPCRDP